MGKGCAQTFSKCWISTRYQTVHTISHCMANNESRQYSVQPNSRGDVSSMSDESGTSCWFHQLYNTVHDAVTCGNWKLLRDILL